MKEVIDIVKKWRGQTVENSDPVDPPSYIFKSQSDATGASKEISSLGITTVKLDKVISLMC
jgi:hypothetical protein